MSATMERRTPEPGTWLGIPEFPKAAKVGLANAQLRKNLAHATTTIRAKRVVRASEVPDWEELRTAAAQIKDRVGRHLDTYLLQAEAAMTAAGITVHWARDAADANRIVADIAKAKGVDEVVKIKSMVTQEIDLNEALEAEGIAAWETDLAELIVQLGHDLPSHILVPAIHRNRREVREIFVEEMGRYGTPAPEGISDNPPELAEAARVHLREKFLRAEMAVSGGNFIVAETGTLVIVESEGNGRMCLTLPKTLVSVVGIEKIVPTIEDLEVFLKLLPRSSTGERMNPYTSLWTGVTDGDGPQDLHVVLLDNGRSRVLSDPTGRAALRCIRCSACLNICPVYERVGGHAYGSPYPGPIGAILGPQLRGLEDARDRALPFASTLCGACNDVCPVKIPFTDILVHLRNKVVEYKTADHATGEQALMKTAAWVMSDGKHLAEAQLATRAAGGVFGKRWLGKLPIPIASRWLRARDVEAPPTQTFRQWWKKNREGEGR
ncbi:MAG TPA: LutB/LldF family L-lactate oxidation iron-sulfur protein [Arachnia sp.]|jgi:L-lactate dehydrogenase complex protein LldF|nr:iron-sulfur cluster-binding protein [Propionibacteriaceae bacterium]HMQ64938.1 LutB/LldF family L-lactate oxidation iron-sulfur protein [Arachnia sp.]HMR12557.1 LutB/LldF family L-lactate oxidation iron-sulfur protein [Arachnia sp.]HOA27104.1 LutB/LldF family L-lactate oxidation iron-sulfur protein [Arachnia sp.]HQD21435.1 LutB/LldF family L-lactate oxidation iron-sulfur protein [Arachnia sp.]